MNTTFLDYVKIFLIISSVICLMIIVIKLKKNNYNTNSLIQILSSQAINHKTHLYIVKIENQKFLLVQSSNNLIIEVLKEHA